MLLGWCMNLPAEYYRNEVAPMGEITGAQWKDFIIVVIAIAATLVLFGNVVRTIKEWKKPSDDLIQWRRDIERKLDNDNKRLQAMESGNHVVCRGMLALLSHELNGNSTDKLKQAQQEITNYLIER